MNIPNEGADVLPTDGFDWITLKVIFQGPKDPKRSNLVVLLLFANFPKNGLITFLIFVYSFLGMILINCQEMDFIELFKGSFSRSEKSALAHFFPIIIDIIQ